MTGPARTLKELFHAVIDRLTTKRDDLLAEQSRATADPNKWELSAAGPPLEWSALEKELLYQLERKPNTLIVHAAGDPQPVKTTLLGFNPQDNSIMMATFADDLHADARLVGQDMRVRVTGESYTLYLQTVILDLVEDNGAFAFIARVTNKNLSKDRRVNPRINFSPAEAPEANLLIPMTGVLRGTVANLSKGGMEIRCLCAHKPKLESHFGETTLFLTDTLQIKSDIKIRNVQWLRQPHSHLRISVVFIGLSTETTDQLSAFIDALIPAESSQVA